MDSSTAPEGTPLSDEELRALPEGTEIIVIWSGGNGPHSYTLAFDHGGVPYAWAKFGIDAYSDERMRFYNPITFVGYERFHTRVWLQTCITRYEENN